MVVRNLEASCMKEWKQEMMLSKKLTPMNKL
jgi:hypothetical protein